MNRTPLAQRRRDRLVYLLLPLIFFPLPEHASAQFSDVDSQTGDFRSALFGEGGDVNDPVDRKLEEYYLFGSSGPTYKVGELTVEIIPDTYTGTGDPEPIAYYVPNGYNPSVPHTMIVCWHGYSVSCLGPPTFSQIDEQCETRNWIFLSVQGHSSKNWGNLLAQVHCTKAIKFMMDPVDGFGLNVDTDRIYMAGYSMGGVAAASYASRHMGMEKESKYPIAGLILVASVLDLIHLYFNANSEVKLQLEQLYGGSPSQVPFNYKQCSGLYMENGTFVLDESMGRNLSNNLPVYVTYAEDEPQASLLAQNIIFVRMLKDPAVQANLYEKYWPKGTVPVPHSWGCLNLDIDNALDFIEQYSLQTLDTDGLALLADRDAQFYWLDVAQTSAGAFSKILCAVSETDNELSVSEALNAAALSVNTGWTGLKAEDELWIFWQSTASNHQSLVIQPLNIGPTYIVDGGGILYSDYSYNGTERTLDIAFSPSADLDLKASYEVYNLSLVTDPQVSLGQPYTLDLSGGDPYDPIILFLSLEQKETHVKNNKHLLLNPFGTSSFWLYMALGPAGELSFPLQIPHDPLLKGVIIHQQFLTYDTGLKEISNMSSTEIIE